MAARDQQFTRRELGRKAVLAGGAIATSPQAASGATGALERRPLGKTGIEVGILGIGNLTSGAARRDAEGSEPGDRDGGR